MYLGQDVQLGLTVSPNVSVPFTFVSENPRIVAALNSGLLQAVKLGETTVTVSYFGHEETCTVRVVTKEEYLALGYKIASESGCGSAISGSYGVMLLTGALLCGLYVCKRKER